jgi:hypothetical protein
MLKQRSGLDPVRNAVMQFGGEPVIEQHRVIVNWAFERFKLDRAKVDRPLRGRCSSEAQSFIEKDPFALDICTPAQEEIA